METLEGLKGQKEKGRKKKLISRVFENDFFFKKKKSKHEGAR